MAFAPLHLDTAGLESIAGERFELDGAAAAASASGGFAEALSQAATALMAPQQAASVALNQFADGADGELHQTLLSMDKADISLKYFVSVRNRCLEAYREIMRMGA